MNTTVQLDIRQLQAARHAAAAVTFRHLPADHSAIGVMMTMKDDTTYPDTTPFRAHLATTEVEEHSTARVDE